MKKEPIIKDFGKRLAKFRKASGLTQEQLGELVGVSKRVIAYYEGETKYPPAHLIAPLSKALNVSADELLGIKKAKIVLDSRLAALWRRLKVLETFSDRDKKAVVQFVEVIAEKNKAKQVIEKQ
ncbi:MAG: helix-turn-helix transcriptional regulator [Desulfobacteraceae bacterium]